jgi:hypothetical protein
MCIPKFLSYCYNNYRQKRENIQNKDHIILGSFINGDKKEDIWIKFKKIEGNCIKCLKYSPLLAIINNNYVINGNICYKCYQNNKNYKKTN